MCNVPDPEAAALGADAARFERWLLQAGSVSMPRWTRADFVVEHAECLIVEGSRACGVLSEMSSGDGRWGMKKRKQGST